MKRSNNRWQFWLLFIISIILILMMGQSVQAKNKNINENKRETFRVVETYTPEGENFKIIVIHDNVKNGDYLILKNLQGRLVSITSRSTYDPNYGKLMIY